MAASAPVVFLNTVFVLALGCAEIKFYTECISLWRSGSFCCNTITNTHETCTTLEEETQSKLQTDSPHHSGGCTTLLHTKQ